MPTPEPGDRKSRIREQFNRIVSDYDVRGPGCFAQFGERLIDALDLAPAARVLDVATGRGAALWPAISRVGSAETVVGVDLSEAMVEATRAEASRRGLAVDIRCMDAEQLEFPDASFDTVLCAFGLMFFPERQRALAQFRRVLRPGGQIGVTTWVRSQAEDLSEVLTEFGHPESLAPGWIDDADQLAQVLREGMFRAVEVRAETITFRYENLEQYWQNARGTGLRGTIDTMAPELERRVRDALSRRLTVGDGIEGVQADAVALIGTARR